MSKIGLPNSYYFEILIKDTEEVKLFVVHQIKSVFHRLSFSAFFFCQHLDNQILVGASL